MSMSNSQCPSSPVPRPCPRHRFQLWVALLRRHMQSKLAHKSNVSPCLSPLGRIAGRATKKNLTLTNWLALPKCPTEPCILAKVARPTALATQIGQGWVRSPPLRESEISQLGPGSGYSWVARLFVTLCVCVCVPALYVCQFLCMSWAGSASTRKLLAPETVAVARLKRIL